MVKAHGKIDSYVNLLMQEWGLDKQHAKFQREVKAVLMELSIQAQLFLRNEPRLQVEVVKGNDVWASFPMHKLRSEAKHFRLRPTTRVLLVIGSQLFAERSRKSTGYDATEHLRDHLGHTLLYLRSPKARNECVDAWREWKECCS